MAKTKLIWKKKPEAQDYAGAVNYLSLICSLGKAEKLVRAMRKVPTVERAAKDLLRASRLPLLPRDEPHVSEDLDRVHKGQPLAPILLVGGDFANDIPLTIADGYHRICAIYYYDSKLMIPCRIVRA
jgi:hypothetical protein